MTSAPTLRRRPTLAALLFLASVLLFQAELTAQSAFYTFTSGPSGDGFIWDSDDPPSGLNDLPTDDTFFAPTADSSGVINIENFSENITFFDNNYQAAGNSSVIQGDAWWGNPIDQGFSTVGASFINTNTGSADSVGFDFAWAIAGQDADEFLEIEVYDEEFDSAYLCFDLDSSFNAGPAFGGFDGWEGSIFFDLLQAQDDNPDVDEIASFSILLSSIATPVSSSEFAIDNLSINGAGGGADNSNVFPYSSFGDSEISGLSTKYLKDSPNNVNISFDVKNDGTDPTTFSAALDGTSDPQFITGTPATNQPIPAGGVEFTGTVATLSTANPSGLYESTVTISNDLNSSDPDESIPYRVTIYDAPDLTDDSLPTVQVDVDGSIFLANAPAGPHAGAQRAGVEVTAITVAGQFTATGFAVDDFIGPGDTQNGAVSFDRYGRLNGAYNGTLTIDLKMNSAAGSFLNGSQPVPAVVWDLEYNLATNANDTIALAATQSLGPSKVGVNNTATAATILDGTSTKAQTVSMALVGDPELGDPVRSAALAANAVDVDFSTSADLYVLQFTYLDANVPTGFTEAQLQLLVFDTVADDWSLAINANSDGGSGSTFFSGAYSEFLAGPGGGVLDNSDLSSFGVDAINHMAWAVLDHASAFSLGVLGTFSFTADVDSDGDVDGNDFLLIQRNNPALIGTWESQFGAGSPLAASTAVPEPTSLLLFLISITVCPRLVVKSRPPRLAALNSYSDLSQLTLIFWLRPAACSSTPFVTATERQRPRNLARSRARLASSHAVAPV